MVIAVGHILKEGYRKQKGLDLQLDPHQEGMEMKPLRNHCMEQEPAGNKSIHLCKVTELYRASEFKAKIDLILVGDLIRCS